MDNEYSIEAVKVKQHQHMSNKVLQHQIRIESNALCFGERIHICLRPMVKIQTEIK